MAKKPTTEAAITDVVPLSPAPGFDKAVQAYEAGALAPAAQEALNIFELGKQVGAIQAAGLARQFLRAAEVRLFQEVKKSKAYKHLPIQRADGISAPAENLAEFCVLTFGASYSKMDEEFRNLEALGAECYEQVQRLGLNRDQVRLIRALPADKQAAVQDAIRVAGDSAAVVALVEGLASDLAAKQAELDEVREERKAEAELSAAKSKQIDKLKTQISRIKAEAPDERLDGLKKELAGISGNLQGLIKGMLRDGITQLRAHAEQHDQWGEHDVFLAGLVGQVQAALTSVRHEFELPDVSTAAGAPEWADETKYGDRPAAGTAANSARG